MSNLSMSTRPLTSKTFNCPSCPKPPYPKNKTGFPFSGNTNNPGSAISGVMRCRTQVLHLGCVNFKAWTLKVNQYGRTEGTPGGSGAPPRNRF